MRFGVFLDCFVAMMLAAIALCGGRLVTGTSQRIQTNLRSLIDMGALVLRFKGLAPL